MIAPWRHSTPGAMAVMWLLVGASAPARADAAANDAIGKVMTVNGPVEPGSVGYALMHEHILANFTLPLDKPDRWLQSGRKRPVAATDISFLKKKLSMDMLGQVMMGKENYDNRVLDSEEIAGLEIDEFRRAGGATLVDLTSVGAGRDPEGLRRISQATGVNIVMGAGLFAEPWFPDAVGDKPIDSLVEQIVRAVTVGAEGTDIRSGIIGELGITGTSLSPAEIKVIRAAGRASRLTGAALSLHVSRDSKEHLKILDILERDGVDLGRVVLGGSNHLAGDAALLEKLLRRGVYIQFDGFGRPPRITSQRWTNSEVADAIVKLIRAGHGARILLSQDVSQKADLRAYGGPGFTFVTNSVLPYLRQEGVTDDEIRRLMIGNPRKVLTLVAPVVTSKGGK